MTDSIVEYNFKNMSDDEKSVLFREWYAWVQSEQYTYSAIAEHYNLPVSGEQLRKIIFRWRDANQLVQRKNVSIQPSQSITSQVHKLMDLPTLSRPLADQVPVLEFEDCLFTADWELPDSDTFMVRAAYLVSIKRGIRRHIINGDFVGNDAAGVNSYDPIFADDYGTFEYQQSVAYRVALGMKEWYTDGLYMTYGNHEDKLNRATGGQVGVYHTALGQLIQMTRYPYLWLKTHRGWAYVVHPANYSRNSAVLGKQLYNVKLTPDNTKPKYIILAHTHNDQIGWSEDGFAEVYGMGCMRSPENTAYINRKATNFPRWTQSFLIMQNGYVTRFSRHATDWYAELGDLYQFLDPNNPMPLTLGEMYNG